MDSLRGFDEDAAPLAAEDEPAPERPPEIGVDERRMHVRAYNYWVSLLKGRAFPSIEDVEPQNLADFGPHSVLLDFSGNENDPRIAFLGAALRAECDLDSGLDRISQVPSRSLLSRLTDHYLQIIANCAPIGFEAEFVGQRGDNTLYRGILMPLSSDGEAIDFIYGVINWKEMADSSIVASLADEVDRAAAAPVVPVWADGPSTAPAEADVDAETLSLWPEAADGLADRLAIARDSAGEAEAAHGRSRAALYRALGHAHDFALAAANDPEGYAELLADAGIRVQARAPMTAIAKLVFGARHDKARLTEYAAVLGWAAAEQVPAGALADQIAGFAGGLKGIVASERARRRPALDETSWEQVRAELRARPTMARVQLDIAGDAEFVLLVARREADGLAIVGPVANEKLVDRALRSAA
ncbi:hypothetical protein [Sphingosinicella sp.]|uniref:hypothetical protein n=1 Tax=Sphingosinicella sp. TaxID=1917971 RepID=UPI004037C867